MIDQRHKIPMDQAVTASLPGKGALVEALYIEAQGLFFNKPMQNGKVIRIREANSDTKSEENQRITATATDEETGVFVQLNGIFNRKSGKAVEGPWLTVGKKFLQEGKSPQLSNTAVKLWR